MVDELEFPKTLSEEISTVSAREIPAQRTHGGILPVEKVTVQLPRTPKGLTEDKKKWHEALSLVKDHPTLFRCLYLDA